MKVIRCSLALFCLLVVSAASAHRAETRAIFGSVLDANGKPAAGVAVILLKPEAAHVVGPALRPPGASRSGDDARVGARAAKELQEGNGPGARQKVIARITTDASGRFKFDNVQPGQYVVLAGLGKVAVRTEIEVDKVDPPAMTITLLPQ